MWWGWAHSRDSADWVGVDVGVSETGGNPRWGEERVTRNVALYLLQGRTSRFGSWMNWEEVEEPCCELRGTVTPVGPQVMGFYPLFTTPRPGVSSVFGNVM